MTDLGGGGGDASNFSITLDDVLDTFDVNDSDIDCNDSVTVLLDAITEELFNITFDDVLDFDEVTVFTNCHNATTESTNGSTPSPVMAVYWRDNGTVYCLNESTMLDVAVNVEEFLTILVDIVTLTPNEELNLSDVSIGQLVNLLNDSLVQDIVEETLNITIDDQWIDDLYDIEYIDEDLTLGQMVEDFVELDIILQILNVLENLNQGRVNVTAINNVIDLVAGDNHTITFTTETPDQSTNSTTTEGGEDIVSIFDDISNISDIVDENGDWTETFIGDLLEFVAEEAGYSEEFEFILDILSVPRQPDCINATSNRSFMDIFMYFDTVEEMEEYTQFSDYGAGKPAISAGIVFNSVNREHIDYTLRFNQTEVHDTTAPYVDRYGVSPELLMVQSFYHYIKSGFLGWQNAIDQTMLRVLNHDVAVQLKMGVHVFPFAPYEEDYFWSVVKGLLPMLMVIAFSYPFVIITKSIVEEKATRVKVLWICIYIYIYIYVAISDFVGLFRILFERLGIFRRDIVFWEGAIRCIWYRIWCRIW